MSACAHTFVYWCFSITVIPLLSSARLDSVSVFSFRIEHQLNAGRLVIVRRPKLVTCSDELLTF